MEMENNHMQSTTPLLELAAELLDIILSDLDPKSLANLALVSSDCRQLARSCQFRNVRIYYGHTKSGLIPRLLEEKASQEQPNGSLNATAIGPFIRQISVSSNSGWIRYLQDVPRGKEFEALEKSVQEERVANAAAVFSKYLRRVETLIACRATLPYLDSLEWEDEVPLQQSFFTTLTTSSLKHLKLNRAFVSQEYEIIQPPVAERWNLQSLYMDLCWGLSRYSDGELSPLGTSLLRSCSYSLETLSWYEHSQNKKYTFGSDPTKIPRFPRLRNLELGGDIFEDNSMVDVLLNSPISVLDLSNCFDSYINEAVRKRGQIPSLKTLLFAMETHSIENYLIFLKANTQITKITVLGGQEYKNAFGKCMLVREQRILPLLSSSFTVLKSLHLSWGRTYYSIPDESLEIISKIQSLEQICLGAGCCRWCKFNWLIDHKCMRKWLSMLPKLKIVAFYKDSYIHPSNIEPHPRSYYVLKKPFHVEEPEDPNGDWGGPSKALATVPFEVGHTQWMVVEAEEYIKVMPHLEWMFLGQYPMAVVNQGLEGGGKVVLLCEERKSRDETEKILDQIFG